MTSKNRQPFEIQSYIGGDIAEPREDGERPPRSAKFVVYLDMGSGPGGGDYRTYLLCTNRERSDWTLWLRCNDYDLGKPLYGRIATGWPYRGYEARFAAEQLLIKSWQDEALTPPIIQINFGRPDKPPGWKITDDFPECPSEMFQTKSLPDHSAARSDTKAGFIGEADSLRNHVRTVGS